MLRLVGVDLPDDIDLFNGLRKIKGLDTKHSRAKIERILTKAGLYTRKVEKDGRVVKVYPKVGELTWKEKQKLIDMIDIPRAKLTTARISPRKLRLVADQIRGKSVDEALAILSFTPKAGAPILLKLLKSAIANASNNHDLKADNLYVAKVLIDGGPTMRRYMTRARGRACRIRKRTSHALIVLREKFVMPKATKAAETGKSAAEMPAKSASESLAGNSDAKLSSQVTGSTEAATKQQQEQKPPAQGGA